MQSREKYQLALVLLVLCGLVLRLYASMDLHLHEWDERYHALVAKNLIKHPLKPTLYDTPILPYDYKSWVSNHIWVHKQPVPLWSMALSMWLFGTNELALRIPSVILSTLGIWLTYFIATQLFNRRVGFLSAFLYSINGLIIELVAGRVATDHIDVFFLFFIQLSVFFSIKYSQKRQVFYNLLVGLAIGLAILTKWLPALIVLPIWLIIVIDDGRSKANQILLQFLFIIVITVIMVLPWQVYIQNSYPLEATWESSFNFRHLTEGLEGHGKPFYYFIDRIRINYGELIYLPLLWFGWTIVRNPRDLRRLAIFLWFFIPFLFFSLAKTKMQAYLVITSPAIFIMIAEFWYWLKTNVYQNSGKWRWLVASILILLLALPVRYSVERIKPFSTQERNPEWARELRDLNKKDIHKGVLLNYDRPIEAMFYTDLTVYSEVPDENVLRNLDGMGYEILVNDDGNLPQNIRELPFLTVLHLKE